MGDVNGGRSTVVRVRRGVAVFASLCCAAGCGGSGAQTAGPVRLDHGRLVSTFTYDEGTARFEPVPASTTPGVPRDRAVQVFREGPYGDSDRYSAAQVFLASFTDHGMTKPGGGHYEQQLIWVVRHTGVPDAGAGPGPGGTVVPHDIVAVIDAATARSLLVLSSLVDPVAMPDPFPDAP